MAAVVRARAINREVFMAGTSSTLSRLLPPQYLAITHAARLVNRSRNISTSSASTQFHFTHHRLVFA